MIEFIRKYIELLAFYPEDVIIKTANESDGFVEVLIYANKVDTGRIIGKNGNMINAITTMINGCKAKDGISYKIQVISKD